MRRAVVATPLFADHLKAYLDEYAEMGAVRFVERLRSAYLTLLENVSEYREIAPARRRSVQGKSLTVHEYLLHAGARDFLVLYWIAPDPSEPILLLNIRIGGQSRFSWKS